MGTSRSSTSSSSRALLRDVAVALLVLVAFEVFLARSLERFLPRRDPGAAPAAPAHDRPDGYHSVSKQDPATFFADLAAATPDARPVVFVGDSQGASAHDHGAPYPVQAAARLRAAGDPVPVISLHLGGANAYEQGTLLVAMLDAGIRPRVVVWSHSIFSQRKNEIRQELVATYRSVEDVAAPLLGPVTLMGGDDPAATTAAGDPLQRVRTGLAVRWDGVIGGTASASFMRRTLYDKGRILRRSDLGRLIPTSVLGGTARRFDPPASVLRDAAGTVGAVTGRLTDAGICVVSFVSPVDRAVVPRPFTERAEAVSYPALAAASREAGAVFLDLLDAMPHARFGTYEDGTPDAFHFDATGHAALADTLLATAAHCTAAAP